MIFVRFAIVSLATTLPVSELDSSSSLEASPLPSFSLPGILHVMEKVNMEDDVYMREMMVYELSDNPITKHMQHPESYYSARLMRHYCFTTLFFVGIIIMLSLLSCCQKERTTECTATEPLRADVVEIKPKCEASV